jgi:hypothetical protein
MPSRPEPADRHELLLGGVKYLLAIRHRNGRYYASWECTACHEISVTNFEGSNPVEAASFAGENIGVHHRHRHRETTEPGGGPSVPVFTWPLNQYYA